MTLISSNALIILWSAGLIIWAALGAYWFWEFYQKITRGKRDRFTAAFMLSHLSTTIFFFYLAVIVPTGKLYDDISLLCGVISTAVGVVSSGLVIYEVYQQTRGG